MDDDAADGDRSEIGLRSPSPVLVIDVDSSGGESWRERGQRAVACVLSCEKDAESVVAFFDGSGRVVVGGSEDQIPIDAVGADGERRPRPTQTCPSRDRRGCAPPAVLRRACAARTCPWAGPWRAVRSPDAVPWSASSAF